MADEGPDRTETLQEMRSFMHAGRSSEPTRLRSRVLFTVYKIVSRSPARGVGCMVDEGLDRNETLQEMRSFVHAGRPSEPLRSRVLFTVYEIVSRSPARGVGCSGIGLTILVQKCHSNMLY